MTWMAATYLGGGGAGQRMASYYFPLVGAAVQPSGEDTHDGSPRRIADYIDEQARKDIERNKELFERAQRQWSDDLDRIIANAFSKVMGEEMRPVQAKERKKIVRIAFNEVKTDGLEYRIREIDRLIREYERTIYLPPKAQIDDEDAVLALLMSM